MHTLALCFALAVQAVPAEEAVRRMKVPDGFEVRLVAAEPTIRQPVSAARSSSSRG